MNFLFKIIILFSKLPLKVLYGLADFIFVILYFVVGYRKDVVLQNLKNSFPAKSDSELKIIRKKFYHNFCDYLVETLKSFTISSHELRVRVQHLNQDVFHEAKKENKNVILLAGHIFNWEWFNALATIIPQEKSFPVYRKVQSSFWEQKVKAIRNRFGNHALEAKEVIRHIFKNTNDGNSVYMFVADQTPHSSEVTYGLEFLHQKTPAFVGYDKLSTRMDLVFVYCEMKKVKRGYYQINYHRIYPDGEKFQEYEVVRKFHKMLETTINKRPDNYLWSHRRWKYQDSIKVMETRI
ncbi:lysophospholipid acyltransferase family protein [Chryseobacterium manosquense]|uniref:Lysophospholipid acyltransferase family protein n=1 Tax=Chryseobacterium manosquense TaxID=2754694 RepID=A0A7H1DXU9_9FLAO|nr:lysophospholipid acyltransferase family protein [Chryseobacterium manosquense]QNS41807.1 lysophospholipid acyltransferase family protein [Chryseobacterium manosquense]